MPDFPSAKPHSKPQIMRTDKHEYRMYHCAGIFRVYRRRIEMGQIVTNKNSIYSFRLFDFLYYPEMLDMLIETLCAWRDKWRATKRKQKPG